MNHRLLLLFLPIVLVAVSITSTAAQEPWTPPRNADGQPDLQGVWTNPTITPFERPVEFGNKAFLTEEEIAEIEARAADNNVDQPPPPGSVGSYNRFWFDSGTDVVSTRQTSLVVDPSRWPSSAETRSHCTKGR